MKHRPIGSGVVRTPYERPGCRPCAPTPVIRTGRGTRQWRLTPRGNNFEVRLLQPHALARPARRLPGAEPQRLGRHRLEALRPRTRPSRVPRVHGPARVRRQSRVRRHRRERAPPERLWPHAVTEHHRRRPRPTNEQRRHRRHRQQHRPLQPADPGRRGVRHARRHQRRAAAVRLPRRHEHGHELLLRPDPGADTRQVRRGPRAHQAGVDRRTSRSPSTASTTSSAT